MSVSPKGMLSGVGGEVSGVEGTGVGVSGVGGRGVEVTGGGRVGAEGVGVGAQEERRKTKNEKRKRMVESLDEGMGGV